MGRDDPTLAVKRHLNGCGDSQNISALPHVDIVELFYSLGSQELKFPSTGGKCKVYLLAYIIRNSDSLPFTKIKLINSDV